MTKELEDRWILGLRGLPVVAISQAAEHPGLTVALAGGATLVIVGPVRLTHGPATAPGVAALPVEEFQRLVGATVVSAIVFKSGSLRAVFSTGHHLNVGKCAPGRLIRIQKPGEFDMSYQGGVINMKVIA